MTNPVDNVANPAISIILPMYNAETCVGECLQSIAGQDFGQAFEVIVIDDCSTDRSAEICREWISRGATNARLIENENNRGVSIARNRGLDEASGKYFMFVDADDLLPPQALSNLFEAAERHGVDIVKGNNTNFDAAGETAARHNVDNPEIVENEAILTTLYQHEKLRGHPWGKLYRRQTLGGVRFSAGVRMAEDLFYCSEVFTAARSLLLLDRNVYRYRKSDLGASGGKYGTGSYLDWLEAVENAGHFASTDEQKRAHRCLLVRTMAQLARECRHLPPEKASEVLNVIGQRREKWQIYLPRLMLKDRLGIRSLVRYMKMRQAIRQIRKAVNGS
ncbi:MAG: glycosyltransferase [Gammaproteobacteria bacterium]|nr:glycosyltransferase [Gammaproteobacteria bacterium]